MPGRGIILFHFVSGRASPQRQIKEEQSGHNQKITQAYQREIPSTVLSCGTLYGEAMRMCAASAAQTIERPTPKVRNSHMQCLEPIRVESLSFISDVPLGHVSFTNVYTCPELDGILLEAAMSLPSSQRLYTSTQVQRLIQVYLQHV
eukprot:1309204-Amphidinium_carterae.1